MPGPFVHNIDPIIAQVGGVYLWWYGASYSFGFIGAFFWLRRVRASLQMTAGDVYTLTIWLALGVLLGGRAVEVFFYEWAFYGEHLAYIPAVWLGGMSTHGILLGAVIATWLYCVRTHRNFLTLGDELAVAGAYIMGLGRLGNFIDGQIAGSVTEVAWAVQFPDLEGFRHPVVLYDGLKNLLLVPGLLLIRRRRHPVVLYDGLKNLLLVPVLLLIRRRRPPRGVVLGHFVLWYGFLRIFIDFFREYRTEFLGLPPGQEFNIFMTVIGVVLIAWAYRRRDGDEIPPSRASPIWPSWGQRLVLGILVALPLIIPSDWTQDVPERYGKRHSGLVHSALYPDLGDI